MLFLLCLFIGIQINAQAQEYSLAELDNIMLSRTTPPKEKEQWVTPLLGAVKNLESKEVIDINFKLAPICRKVAKRRECRDSYIPFNPSIMKTPEGYAVICRSTDHYLGTEAIPGVEFGNINYFLRYDKNFKLIYEQEIPAFSDDIAFNISKYHQIEDCRPFNWGEESWIAGTVLVPRKDNRGHLTRMALTRINCSERNQPVCFQDLTILEGPIENRQEKNWMPVVFSNSLQFIYLYDPFIMLQACTEKGICKEILRYTPTLDFSRFRGSAAPLEFDNGYLMMVHERFDTWNYTHRFIFMDKNFTMTKISLPFKFEGINVEFCTSMVIDHSHKNLAIGAGIYDSRAKIFIVDIEYVRNLLYAIPT